jgi:hypothetical protein
MRELLIICALVIMFGFINLLVWFSRLVDRNRATFPGVGGLIFSGVLILIGFFGGVIVILALGPQ